MRLGDEIVSSSDESVESDVENQNPVNTRHYQIDNQFAPKYFFITNVRLDEF